MADDGFPPPPPPPPIRLMNFISENQLDEAKRNRGVRVEDGTAQRDRPLFEILKENKDKKDAEFNERFKHRPPKALDEDETEFLDRLEMSRREYEQQVADDEAQQLRSFQAAVAAQSASVHEVKETTAVPIPQEEKLIGKKKKKAGGSLGMIIKVKKKEAAQGAAKKAKMMEEEEDKSEERCLKVGANVESEKASSKEVRENENGNGNGNGGGAKEGTNTNSILSDSGGGLVSYSDESE